MKNVFFILIMTEAACTKMSKKLCVQRQNCNNWDCLNHIHNSCSLNTHIQTCRLFLKTAKTLLTCCYLILTNAKVTLVKHNSSNWSKNGTSTANQIIPLYQTNPSILHFHHQLTSFWVNTSKAIHISLILPSYGPANIPDSETFSTTKARVSLFNSY